MSREFQVKGITFGKGMPVICIPVVERTEDAILAQIRKLTEQNTAMIEWRVDHFDRIGSADAVRDLLEQIRPLVTKTVFLFSIRTVKQGGLASIDEPKIIRLNEIAAASGVCDFIDLELFEASKPLKQIRKLQKKGVKIIASHHDFKKTPPEQILRMLMDQMEQSGADIAKLAMYPQTVDDVIRMMKFTNDTREHFPELPIVTMSMGPLGSLTRICGELTGSCITFGMADQPSAPGQIPVKELRETMSVLHRTMMKSVFLIGFMGTGKSSTARKLSQLAELPVYEMDEEIEKKEGRSIPEIFSDSGEPYFRDLETQMCRDFASMLPCIVSTGGGTPMRRENADYMKAAGTVILLTAEPQTVLSRMASSHERPLLKGHMDDPDFVAELMAKRREAYQYAADHVIKTDGKTPAEVAQEIAALLF